ncbi:unnamed protein product [Cochlearia groenlandica]
MIILNSLFGLCTSFWLAISIRFLFGCFNCLLGVIRAYASEVVSEEYHSLSLSVVRLLFILFYYLFINYQCSLLHHLHETYIVLLHFFRFPYILPSLVISVYATGFSSHVVGFLKHFICVIAYSEIFSLWAVSDRSYGGLSFSSQDVGQVLAISGLGLLVFQLLVYPPLEKTLGLLAVIRFSAINLEFC